MENQWRTFQLKSLCFLLISLFALAGCTQQQDKKIVLRVAGWSVAGDDSDSAKLEREVFAEFERLNPGVEIQLENIPGSQDYVRKILLGVVAKSEPDIIRLDASSAAVFIENDTLVNLTPFIENDPDFDLHDFYPNVVDIARKGNSLYAIPIDFTPLVVYYNKEIFDMMGVPYPTDHWTWDEFLNKSKALTNSDHYGYTYTNWMPGWLPWVWNNQGDVLGSNGKAWGTANSAQTAEALAWIRDLVTVHKVAPSLSQMAAEGAAPFINGKAAMETSGHWNLTTIANSKKIDLNKVGIARLPVSRKNLAPTTVIYESGWSIGKNCKNPAIAWRFIKYYTSYEVQKKIQSTGIGICGRKDIANERATNDLEKLFLEIVPSGRRPWGSKIENYNYVEAQGQRAMDSILKSGKDPMIALEEFARSVDRQLEKK